MENIIWLSRLKSTCQLDGVENNDLSFNMGFRETSKTVLPNFERIHVNFNWHWIVDALGLGKCLHVQKLFKPFQTNFYILMNIKNWTVYLEEGDCKSVPSLPCTKRINLTWCSQSANYSNGQAPSTHFDVLNIPSFLHLLRSSSKKTQSRSRHLRSFGADE